MAGGQTTYITPDELCQRLGGRFTKKTLANWRSDEKRPGPAFARFGNRILYPLEEVLRWEKARQYGTTKDYGKKQPTLEPA
jgi:hypothetical protein